MEDTGRAIGDHRDLDAEQTMRERHRERQRESDK
jgi:hypothetical protein